MDVSRILSPHGCSQATCRRVKSAQTRLRDEFSKTITASTKRELEMAWRAIDLIGISSLRELLDIHEKDVLRVSDYGGQAWPGVLALQGLIQAATPDDTRIVDSPSFEALVRSLVHRVFKSHRAAEIMLSRYALGRSSIPTYEEIGKKHGVTRARVDQIVHKGKRILSSQAGLKLLAPLWAEVEKVIDKNGGLVEVSTLAQKLSRRFGWKSRPKANTLANVLLPNRELHIYGNSELLTHADFLKRPMQADSVCRKDFPCVTCGQGSINLSRVLKSGPQEMDITKAGRRTADICSRHCPRGIKPPSRFPSVLVVHFASCTDKVIVQDDRVYTKKQWSLRWGESPKEVAVSILEAIGHPVHYSELAKRIRSESMRYKNVSDLSIHACMMYYDQFQLAGRGTYGLASRKARPYRSHGQAIIELLEKSGKPMSASRIVSRLVRRGAFKPRNLRVALTHHSRLAEVGEDMYDLRERVKRHKRRKR